MKSALGKKSPNPMQEKKRKLVSKCKNLLISEEEKSGRIILFNKKTL